MKMWAGINSCRLYLGATTIADITNLDGGYIPERVRSVKSAIREQRLLFPLQGRPCRQSIGHWNQFIDIISQNGQLHTKLGKWVRSPDQIYPYMYDPETDIVYKRSNHLWRVFGRRRQNSKRFHQAGMTVDSPSSDSRPIRVIDGSRYVIPMEINRAALPIRHREVQLAGEYTVNLEAGIIGKYDINENQLQHLHSQWKNLNCRLVGATDTMSAQYWRGMLASTNHKHIGFQYQAGIIGAISSGILVGSTHGVVGNPTRTLPYRGYY